MDYFTREELRDVVRSFKDAQASGNLDEVSKEKSMRTGHGFVTNGLVLISIVAQFYSGLKHSKDVR